MNKELVSVVGVCPGPGSSVTTLVLKSDEEETIFRSYLYRSDSFPDKQSQVLFDAKTWLTSLWTSPAGQIWASGIHGEIWTESGGTFRSRKISGGTLHRIWGLKEEVFAVGDAGAVFRIRDEKVEDIRIDTELAIYGIHGSADGPLAAVGQKGGFYLREDKTWESIPVPTSADLKDVYVRDRHHIYLCGGGECFLYQNQKLTALTSGKANYTGICAFKENIYFGAGNGGTDVLQGDRVIEFKDKALADRLAASDDFMWTCGGNAIFRFDGANWLRSTFE